MECRWFLIVDPWETYVLVSPYCSLTTLITYGFRSRPGLSFVPPLFSLVFWDLRRRLSSADIQEIVTLCDAGIASMPYF